MKTLLVGLSSIVLFIMAPSAFSQQSGFVKVDLGGSVAKDIAKNIKADVSQIPVSVQVPVKVAATVCHIAADLLTAEAESGTGSCTAVSTSHALDRIVLDQIKSRARK
ncbi:hypothetical protein [Nitrosovibrio tenuis]|uniref:UrcA family protein n=1 Tax=Nitrosovibrio tenuis TaxID=1233 RepID=A0A1H7G890_9PROT|nr:hypothetical protein [Nitrosovibrio tenuis]SEK34284.1 hypothetical protein SAMN05216387_101204 [Nitrosovibrio tenuis]